MSARVYLVVIYGRCTYTRLVLMVISTWAPGPKPACLCPQTLELGLSTLYQYLPTDTEIIPPSLPLVYSGPISGAGDL